MIQKTMRSLTQFRSKFNTKSLNGIAAIALTSLILASCAKEKDAVAPEKLEITKRADVIPTDDTWRTIGGVATSGQIKYDGTTYSVKDFAQAYTGAPGQPPAGNFYFSFRENRGALNSDTADIHFSGIATGDIKVRNTNDLLKYVDASWSSVTYSTWSTANTPDANTIGMNQVTGTGVPPSVAAYANGKGWYNYAWGPHTVAPVSGRVLLFRRDADGRIFKFQFSSMYSGGGGSGSFPFFWFQYEEL